MNLIFCRKCSDIVRVMTEGMIRECYCGNVLVKYIANDRTQVIVKYGIGSANVIKLFNPYIMYGWRVATYLIRHQDTLFFQEHSDVILASLDTPGVEVVDVFK